ncbi:alpha/beta hydrolase [Aspergillus sclerotioniger CBS 115572]|uniref:Alpha/beta hydrolase n=1 Tax=Aspergillus sclerotioniger CBS 115572 TaxID=1450535 RepID=A0A317X3X1_9EURO|nr:alpha/beta hydrolase [Aspergillus sclerotioniger CBS 115572]PWY93045.1 alpha/beta hydrolase [Aspergillus sclerotioniger CBS 115572]
MDHFRHTANIGTHTLSYALRGIPRQPGTPLVIILTGITSSALEWSAVCRHLEHEASILLYERSGYGKSETTTAEPDSVTIVDELSRLLITASLPPPYLVVGHSWGGMLAREFLAAHGPDKICGMVLVDAVQERMLFKTWPDPSIAAVTAEMDYMEVVGLKSDYRLTEDEWAELMDEEDSTHHSQQAVRELPYLQISRAVLAEKQQLRPGLDLLQGKPLSVLRGNSQRDQQRMYDRAVALGLGTEEQRETFRKYLEIWDSGEEEFQRELLNLSSNARYSVTRRSGHNIQITEPERVAEEIRWVLQRTAAGAV